MRRSLVLGLCILLRLHECMPLAAQVTAAASGSQEARDPNWARDYVTEDPLAAQPVVTLDDIRRGLESGRRRGTVIDRHFPRVQEATDAQKREFLSEALKSEFPEVQRQAARALAALGELEAVVRALLLEFLRSQDPKLREAAVIGLEQISFDDEDWPEEYWSALIENLASTDPAVSERAAAVLEKQGATAVPALLATLQRPDSPAAVQAAAVLTRIVGSQPPAIEGAAAPGAREKPGAPAPMPMPTPAPVPQAEATVAKAPSTAPVVHFSRNIDIDLPKRVRVYFGTNREAFAPEQPAWNKLLLYPVVALLLLYALASLRSGHRDDPRHRRRWLGLLMTFVFIGAFIWTLAVFRSELLDRWRIGTGPRFGPRRDPAATVHYGTCEVSIPPKHTVGAIEKPLLGPEDENVHVVLQKTEELEAAQFFDAVRARTAELPQENRACFVFIHGFNVTFENAAKRTAQIHYDLQFPGVPIFFSWPSRGSVRHYFSDRNEIEFSLYLIKQFLLDVSQRVNADRIHVIAHSMGADATCRAIADLGEQGKIFDQIILAAPDIDRDVFRLELAPRLTRSANRTTMYCSQNDWALIASKTFNDSPRAGDSRKEVLVVKEVDTIDASGIDTDLLGHSYYGDCLPILNDVRQVVLSHLPPAERKLRPWPVENELMYWTLANVPASDEAVSVEREPAPASVPTPEL